MVSLEKVSALSELASYDMEQEERLKFIPLSGEKKDLPLYEAKTPKGRCTLFKTLMTNNCKMDCKYCINSNCSRHRAAHKYSPAELAEVFSSLAKRGLVQGLFLSSSIEDPVDSMEKILEAGRIIRVEKSYRGYIHLKILPGSSFDQIKSAMQIANRVSINLESVSPSHLAEIASNKDFKNDILKRQAWIRGLIKGSAASHPQGEDFLPKSPEERSPGGGSPDFNPEGVPTRVSHTSQVMVGVDGESDWEIFSLAASEYDYMDLSRLYYSAFKPIGGTPLENHPAAPLWRQNRLYQADWLYRVYNYSRDEMHFAFDEDFLPNTDPKILIARELFQKPLEVNGAEEQELIRIPGIGPKAAKTISSFKGKITSMRTLSQLGAIAGRALPFVKINGLHQTTISSFS
jgi:predicted DNA-binding helix-hairpin-helix protein